MYDIIRRENLNTQTNIRNVHVQRKDDTERWPSISQEERSQKKPNLPTPSTWTSCLQNSEKIIFCCLSHPVCGILSWKPSKLIQRLNLKNNKISKDNIEGNFTPLGSKNFLSAENEKHSP
jgi:hypothetical protein